MELGRRGERVEARRDLPEAGDPTRHVTATTVGGGGGRGTEGEGGGGGMGREVERERERKRRRKMKGMIEGGGFRGIR